MAKNIFDYELESEGLTLNGCAVVNSDKWVADYVEKLNNKGEEFKELLDSLWELNVDERKERRHSAAAECFRLPEEDFLWEVENLFANLEEFDGCYVRRLDGSEREFKDWLGAWLAWASNGWADTQTQLRNLIYTYLYKEYDEGFVSYDDNSEYDADVVEDIDYGTLEVRYSSDDYAAIEADLEGVI